MTRVAIITGGGTGIGAAIARALATRGWRILINYTKSEADAQKTADACRAAGGEALVAQGNVARDADCRALVAQAVAAWGRLDALVNNASSFFPTPVGTISLAQWDALIDSNLKAPLFLSQAAVPALAEHAGCIVNITDIHGERPLKGHCVYSVAKAGLVMLTRSLARELGPRVRVNAVAPGAILWPEREPDESGKQAILTRTALKRQGTPEDIARAVLFLIRDGAYITGQILAVDGGRSLYT